MVVLSLFLQWVCQVMQMQIGIPDSVLTRDRAQYYSLMPFWMFFFPAVYNNAGLLVRKWNSFLDQSSIS